MNCVSLLQIWNVSNGELLHLCAPISVEEGATTHGGWVTDLCFSPDTKMLVSAGGYLKVRDSQRLREKSSLYPTFQAIFTSCVLVGPHTTHQKEGQLLLPCFGCRDGFARLLFSGLLEVLMTVLGIFSDQGSHNTPYKSQMIRMTRQQGD